MIAEILQYAVDKAQILIYIIKQNNAIELFYFLKIVSLAPQFNSSSLADPTQVR